jgi:AraC-like DNA-binding protein
MNQGTLAEQMSENAMHLFSATIPILLNNTKQGVTDCDRNSIMNGVARDTVVRRVVIYIGKNLNNDLGISQLAAIACMERSAFSKRFKRSVGVSCSEMVSAWRVASALHDIQCSGKTIDEIRRSLGFEHPSTFYRIFRRYCGCSPANFKADGSVREMEG